MAFFVDMTTLIRYDARVLWLGYAGAASGLAARTYLAAWAGAAYRLAERRAAGEAIEHAVAGRRLEVPRNIDARSPRRRASALKAFLDRRGY